MDLSIDTTVWRNKYYILQSDYVFMMTVLLSKKNFSLLHLILTATFPFQWLRQLKSWNWRWMWNPKYILNIENIVLFYIILNFTGSRKRPPEKVSPRKKLFSIKDHPWKSPPGKNSLYKKCLKKIFLPYFDSIEIAYGARFEKKIEQRFFPRRRHPWYICKYTRHTWILFIVI